MRHNIAPEMADILACYGVTSADVELHPLGKGNINTTFLVKVGRKRFVLQRISSAVFPDPSVVASNFRIVTEHIRAKAALAAPDFRCPVLIPTQNGDACYMDGTGGVWRAQTYIEHSLPPARMNTRLGYDLGSVLGVFHSLTSDLDITLLDDPLPGFHQTVRYLAEYRRTLSSWQGEFSAELDAAIGSAERYSILAPVLEHYQQVGLLRPQTIHGDPKLDNVIFLESGEVVGLFDLDTVGEGLIHWDLGDCLRSCCNQRGESAADPSEIFFDWQIGQAVLRGYFASATMMMNGEERAAVIDAVAVITFELGLRFLLDHLRGDVYFRVVARGDNLKRSLVQFSLLDSFFAQKAQIHRTLIQL